MAYIQVEDPSIHYKPLLIFFGYLGLESFFIFVCCRTVYDRYQARQKQKDWAAPQRRGQLLLFAILAALSFGTTWYYMISFFAHSYNNWAMSPDGLPYSDGRNSPLTRMSLWLNKTCIFQQAWETVSENSSRVWWSGQIFEWTIGWSVFLGITGRRYRIPHVWVFMLVAQGVSVAFAANIFFATITVSQQPHQKQVTLFWHPRLIYELAPVLLSLLDTLAVPMFTHKPAFMPILLAPHLLVFIPCILSPQYSSPSKPTQAQSDCTTQRYITFIQFVGAASVSLQAYFTALMLQDAGPDMPYGEITQYLVDTVYVHPACSSVSWDVIMCALSAISWALVHKGNTSQMLGGQ